MTKKSAIIFERVLKINAQLEEIADRVITRPNFNRDENGCVDDKRVTVEMNLDKTAGVLSCIEELLDELKARL